MDASKPRDANSASFDPLADDVFRRIAEKYDFLCDVFSLYAHRLWKNRMARRISEAPGRVVLDVATGTGDIPYRTSRRSSADGRHYYVTDLSPAMLEVATQKLGEPHPAFEYRVLDAHELEGIESGSIDIYSISFAMKILDRPRVLAEAFRVLKPGGSFFCLEASRIPIPVVNTMYLKYMEWCVPLIGRIATGGDSSAYEYLLRGINRHPGQREFSEELRHHGFESISHENLSFGIVAIHTATKGGRVDT